MSKFRIEMHYFDLALCAGIELYHVPPEALNKWKLYQQINAKLQTIGLRLTKRPYWLRDWQVEAINGWTLPAQKLAESHWHFKSAGQQRDDFERMPAHLFVDTYIGYLKHVEG